MWTIHVKTSGVEVEMKFTEESAHKLTRENIGQIYYDHGKAWTVKENNGHLEWVRSPGMDAERES